MDEEQRRLIRIDPHKVQQKVYDLYPTNSVVRRTLIASAKTREIENLSKALDDAPVKVAQAALKKNTLLIYGTAFYGLTMIIGALVIFTYALLYRKTFLEGLFGFPLASIFFSTGLTHLKDVWYLRKMSQAFAASVEKIKLKINDLQK